MARIHPPISDVRNCSQPIILSILKTFQIFHQNNQLNVEFLLDTSTLWAVKYWHKLCSIFQHIKQIDGCLWYAPIFYDNFNSIFILNSIVKRITRHLLKGLAKGELIPKVLHLSDAVLLTFRQIQLRIDFVIFCDQITNGNVPNVCAIDCLLANLKIFDVVVSMKFEQILYWCEHRHKTPI